MRPVTQNFMKCRTALRAGMVALWGMAMGAMADDKDAGLFFAPVADRGKDLPADEMYPRGRMFPFWGYSGTFTREKASGFTLGGQHYGNHDNQMAALQKAHAAGLKYLFAVGLPGNFVDGSLKAPPETWADTIALQVRDVGDNPGVAAWVIHPEELRMWRKNEVEYLRTVTATIRATDPLHRPIFMYEPNSRTADSMVISAEHLEYITRGAYVQGCGFQNERVWVRWVLGQQVEAARRLKERDGRERPPWFMAQLSDDPANPADDEKIAAWVRHDVYAAVISGARGVGIWSLWAGRRSVKRTYEKWYAAYATVAGELTGPEGLGQPILFGEERSDIAVRQMSGPAEVVLWTGPRNNQESNATSEAERARNRHVFPTVASREWAWKNRRYFVICNSSDQPVELELSGWPAQGCEIHNIFTHAACPREPSMRLKLPPWGVEALEFRPASDR